MKKEPFDRLRVRIVFVATALLLAGMSAAGAATVKGRVTMIDEKNRQITVDNSDVYSVAPNVDLNAIAVGAPAQLDVTRGTVTSAKKTG